MQSQIDVLQATERALSSSVCELTSRVGDAPVSAAAWKSRMTQQMNQPATPLEATRCTASGAGIKGDLTAGKPVSFTIMTYRTKRKPGQDLFDVVFRKQPDGAVVEVSCTVVDKKDGSHLVTYTWPHSGSVFTLSLEAGGKAIKGSPFTVTCQ